ncbi:MAG: PilZ domain-containing protein [Myxococcota bacterium]
MARNAEVWAVVRRLGESWTGRMVSARGFDQPCLLFSAEAAPPAIALGTQVELGLATRRMAKAVSSGAQVIAVEWTPEGVEMSLDPDDPELFKEAIPGLVTHGDDRRNHVRVFPRTGDGIQVSVRIQEDLAGNPLLARVTDASTGGLGLLFPYDLEERLCFARVLLVELESAGGESREVECEVRNRTLVVDGVRYGVEFRASREPVPQPFEPLWDCSCGATGLLAASHLRCPACGRPQQGTTRIPHRNGRLSATLHPYQGTAQTCRGCGAVWSAEAKHCARCGLVLARPRGGTLQGP